MGFGYGLNEKPKTAIGNSFRQPGPRASPRFGSSEMQPTPQTTDASNVSLVEPGGFIAI